MPRKTAPHVKLGEVQKKNNWDSTTDAVFLAGAAVAFERRRPGAGYRHLIRKADLEQFTALLPDWDELAVGLRLVILDAGDEDADGWHFRGTVGITAWERGLWVEYDEWYLDQHKAIIERLGVPTEPTEAGVLMKWTEETARAFQLLHVFLHELGHHHDRMTTRSKRRTARGEGYAEEYANRYADQ